MSTGIVIFDGECALCNGFVAWLVRHDTAGEFRLAGSNGDAGRALIARAGLPATLPESTIVVSADGRALMRSDAVLAIMAQLPRPWRWLRAARVVPRGLRDRVYDAVAARRSRVKADDPACGVPPADLVEAWRARLVTMEDVAAADPPHKKTPHHTGEE